MQYFNLKISTTQPKITVIEYVTNRRSTHLQLNCVRLGQTVPFTKPQTKSESLTKNWNVYFLRKITINIAVLFYILSMALGSLLFCLRVLQQTARWRVFLVCNMIIKRHGLQNADDCRMWMRENGHLARQMVCQRYSIPVEEHPYARLQDGVQCNKWALGSSREWLTLGNLYVEKNSITSCGEFLHFWGGVDQSRRIKI